MAKWNEQAAPNNNLSEETIASSDMMLGKVKDHAFSEDLADGDERDQFIEKQAGLHKEK